MGNGKLALLLAKHSILCLCRAMDLMAAIRVVLHEFRRHFLGKKYLPDVRSVSSLVRFAGSMTANANFEMDVVGAPHVETWKHRAKAHASIRSCELYAAKEGELVSRCVVWWRTHRPGSAGAMLKSAKGEVRVGRHLDHPLGQEEAP